MLRDEDAKQILQCKHKLEQNPEAVAEPAQDAPQPAASSRKSSTSLWSSWGKKASKLGSKAKKAIVDEAMQVAEDVKDLSGGVREGVQLTAQDTKWISEKLKLEAKDRGWLGGFGQLGSSISSSKAASQSTTDTNAVTASTSSSDQVGDASGTDQPATSGSSAVSSEDQATTLKTIKQNLAVTADVSKDLRQGVLDIGNALWEFTASATTAAGSGSSSAPPADQSESVDPAQVMSSPLESYDAFMLESLPESSAQATKVSENLGLWAENTAKVSMGFLRKTADDLSQGLRGLQQQYGGALSQQEIDAAFWSQPSARANYVHVVVAAPASMDSHVEAVPFASSSSLEVPAADVVSRKVRKFGGKLAKQTQRVSASIAQQAMDLGQNLQSRAATASPAADERDADDIFEIGSGEEEAMSDDDDFLDNLASGISEDDTSTRKTH